MAHSVDDLRPAPRLTLDWAPEKSAESLRAVFDFAMDLSEEAANWYIRAKNGKRFFARAFRVLAILLGAAGALLPTLGEMLADEKGRSAIPAGWTAILLGTVGALLLLDRFFGFSTGWMRYMATELHIRQIAQEFQLAWEAERALWRGSEPTREQVVQMLARCKDFVLQVNGIVREETSVWTREFESAIRQIDDATKARPAVREATTLKLTSAGGDAAQASHVTRS